MPPAISMDNLCLQCGLCCDGTLFRDVELQDHDDSDPLTAEGIRLRRFKRVVDGVASSGRRFSQPCSALGSDCRCSVYPNRPDRCRSFDCALLQAVSSGSLTPATALRKIRPTRALAERARQLLTLLGDTETKQPLVRRFKRIQRQFLDGNLPEGIEPDVAAEYFGDLAAVVGELQLALRVHFYPADS